MSLNVLRETTAQSSGLVSDYCTALQASGQGISLRVWMGPARCCRRVLAWGQLVNS